MLQASGSKLGGGDRFKGTPFVPLTLRPAKLMGTELRYWVQSDRMNASPSGTPHILNT